MTDTERANPGSHQDGDADVLLVVQMDPNFFNRLVVAGNATAARMNAEISLSDFCLALMHEALEVMAKYGATGETA
jgi:hypothetical protein